MRVFKRAHADILAAVLLFAVLAVPAFAGTAGASFWDNLMKNQSRLNMGKGVYFMQVGLYGRAEQEFAKAVVKNPADPAGYILLGSAHYWNGNIEQAESDFRKALELEPDNSDALQLMGIVRAKQGDMAGALENFIKAEKQSPNDPSVNMNLGSAYFSLGDKIKSLDYFRRAVNAAKRHPLFHYQLGLAYSRLGRDSSAEESLKNAISLYPAYEDALFELGCLYERIDNTPEALRYYGKALAQEPRDYPVRFRYARLLIASGETKKALKVIEEGFLLTPNKGENGLSLSLAYGGRRNGGGGELAQSLKNNLEKFPLDKEIKMTVEMISVSEQNMKVKEKSESVFEKAYTQMKEAATSVKKTFVFTAGSARERIEQISSAVSTLQNTMTAVSGKNTRISLDIQTGKKGYFTGENYDEGDNSKTIYAPRDVGNDMGLWIAGNSWISHIVRPLEELEREENISPENSLLAGFGYVILGEPRKSLEKFNGKYGEALLPAALLGKSAAFVEMGDEKSAADACRDVLKLNPKNKTAKQNLKWLTEPSKVKQ